MSNFSFDDMPSCVQFRSFGLTNKGRISQEREVLTFLWLRTHWGGCAAKKAHPSTTFVTLLNEKDISIVYPTNKIYLPFECIITPPSRIKRIFKIFEILFDKIHLPYPGWVIVVNPPPFKRGGGPKSNILRFLIDTWGARRPTIGWSWTLSSKTTKHLNILIIATTFDFWLPPKYPFWTPPL